MGASNTQKKKSRRRKKKGILKQILPYAAIVLVAAALIWAVILVTGQKGRDKEKRVSAVELDKTSAPTETEKSRLERDSNKPIADLLQRYFQAKKNADADEMNKIVITGNNQLFDKESMELEAQFTESYSNISYYVAPGIVENTYIVFVCYDEKFIGIDTKAPSMRRFYICEDTDGAMAINLDSQSWSDEVNAYMNEVSGWPEVRELTVQVNTKLQEACENDSKLNDFVRMLNGEGPASDESEGSSQEEGSSQLPEETTGAENDAV